LAHGERGSPEWVHALVEATKIAMRVRDAHVTDPHRMSVHATTYLSDHLLDRLASEIDPAAAQPANQMLGDGDTVWLGVIDGQGRAVSDIATRWSPGASRCTPCRPPWRG